MRQLDLHLRFGASRANGEDVENEFGAINHTDADPVFEIFSLRRRELVVENQNRSFALFGEEFEFFEFAGADVGGGVGAVNGLRQFTDDGGASGVGEAGEFGEVLGDEMPGVAAFERDADEDGFFLWSRERDDVF